MADSSDARRVSHAARGDDREVLTYLVVPESDQYIAIMDVLEASVLDLTEAEVATRLSAVGVHIATDTLDARLQQLRTWGAVSSRPDASRILRYADLLGRHWRYCATPAGRHVQRFYRTVLAGTKAVREIPLPSLHRVVAAAEELAGTGDRAANVEMIRQLFINHDDLDAALVGAEDSLAGLIDRFDLNDAATTELKSLLVGYATHVAVELDQGAARTYRALASLRGRFPEFAASTVASSDARTLIERGALVAGRGGRVEDWRGLLTWFDPTSGRAARFGLRLVRALPGMHLNLRRLHSSAGSATGRSRALALARACGNPEFGTAVFLAAVGDHRWRKLYGEADDSDSQRPQGWRDAPKVTVPELLRLTGRSGARGRAPAARDDSAAREVVEERRRQRAAIREAAIQEILAAAPGSELSDPAARVALATLLAATRASARAGRRHAERDGLSCTVFDRPGTTGLLCGPRWRVMTPSRWIVFHRPGDVVEPPQDSSSDLGDAVEKVGAVR